MRKRFFKSIALIATILMLTSILGGCQLLQKEPSLDQAEDLIKDGDIDEAIDMLEALIDDDDEDHDLWKTLVEVYIEDEEYEDAADVMEDWAEIIEDMYEDDPDDVEDAIDDYQDLKEELEDEEDDLEVYVLDFLATSGIVAVEPEQPDEPDLPEQPELTDTLIFEDANLEIAIIEYLDYMGYDLSQGITEALALSVDSLNLSWSDITSLEGIQAFENVLYLDLQGDNVEDLSPLSHLTQLEELNLWNNLVSDLTPISRCTDLVFLEIGNNQVRDLSPLSGLIHLEILYMNGNPIEDYSPISNLPELDTIDVEIGFSGETELVIFSTETLLSDGAMYDMADDFMTLYPNIEISWEIYQYDSLQPAVDIAVAAGEDLSLVYMPHDYIPRVSEYSLQPVTNAVDQDLLYAIDDQILDGGMIDGDYYFVPMTVGGHLCFMYNSDLVQRPYSWQEIIDESEHMLNQGDYGLTFYGIEPYWFIGFYNGFGGNIFNRDGAPSLNNQHMAEALTFYRDLVNATNALHLDYLDMDEAFSEGYASYIINGGWAVPTYEDSIGDALNLMVPPDLPSGNPPIFFNSLNGFVLPQSAYDSDELAAINLFMAYLLTPENNAKLALNQQVAPAVYEARYESIIESDPSLTNLIAIADETIPLPIRPEMVAVWDAIREELSKVLYEGKDPADAAENMQVIAERRVAEIQAGQ